METAQIASCLTADEYLAGERVSEVRHEYLRGSVYAMAGASEEHNTIVGNIFAALHGHLRGKPCRPFVNDMKVRLEVVGEDAFYYPDIMVACDPRDSDRYFKRYPKVLIEVLSPDTERTDRREKFLSYTQIETLQEYVLVAQDKREITVYRRGKAWHPEVPNAAGQALCLNSLEFSIPIEAVYEGVNFGSSP